MTLFLLGAIFALLALLALPLTVLAWTAPLGLRWAACHALASVLGGVGLALLAAGGAA